MFFGIDLSLLLQLVGYPGVFAIIFAESGIIIGFFLPGGSLLFTAGLLASTGLFNPWILIPLVTIAAILGDNVGYWFGNKVGIKLFTRPDSKLFHQSHLRAAQHFYEKHGAKAIFLARFVPIIRTFAPIVAGIASIQHPGRPGLGDRHHDARLCPRKPYSPARRVPRARHTHDHCRDDHSSLHRNVPLLPIAEQLALIPRTNCIL
jgi:membrane protein YqaA with SNARE-associated domain